MLLTGKRAIVTGAGGRIGRGIVARFAHEGASIAALDRTVELVETAVANLEVDTCALVADVQDEMAIERAVDAAERRFGRIDILVNSHGVFPNSPITAMSVSEWDKVFNINTRGTMLMCRSLARRWIAEGNAGNIVNITSGAATSARAGAAHYCGSKAAVNLLTHVLAIELGPHAIRVNAVAPGLVLNDVLTPEVALTDPYVKTLLDGTPLRRTGRPDDIAETAAFLASDRSNWTTGAIVEVTGGAHCGRPHLPLSSARQ